MTGPNPQNMWSRKFLLVAGSQMANIVLFATGVLSEDGFVALTMAILGGFVVGNVSQHIFEPKRSEP